MLLISLAAPSWGADPHVHRIGIDKLVFGPAPHGLHVIMSIGLSAHWCRSFIG